MSKRNNNSKYREHLIARGKEAKTVRKIVITIILSLILLMAFSVGLSYMYIKSSLQPVNPNSDKEIKVDIPIGSSSSSIAKKLEENGVIKDQRVFRLYTKLKNTSEFQAGVYTFTPSMSVAEIIQSLKLGRVVSEPIYRVTIPEGKTIEEMAEIFSEQLPIKKKDFLEKVNEIDFLEELIHDYSVLSKEILNPKIRMPLEGYLFAATYDFYEENPTVESIIERMLEKTEEVVLPYRDEIEAQNMTVHQVITFASLVEKEASTEEQRKTIAGVFFNRLKKNMPLQTDPTVLYALGKHKEKVLLKDLEVESPYNTYRIDTLPVGPIANFSENSLKATIQPKETKYMYFLHDEEGNIYYAETHDEHKKLKKQYIK
ncbi:MAG TPA: endolytic transglycosylase MltG [Bacillota bacterium]